MFNFKSKNLIKDSSNINPREVMTNFLSDNQKISLDQINHDIFQEIEAVKTKNDKAYININARRFKHLLATNQYVDFSYLALQFYLIQDNSDEFKYAEIQNLLLKIISALENMLIKSISISIADKIYITSSNDVKLKINQQFIPRIWIQKEKPTGAVFSVEDINLNFHGVREIALYKLIVKNFDDLLIELLDRICQILLGDLLLMKINFDYTVIPSGKFLFGSQDARDLSQTAELHQSKLQETSDHLTQPHVRSSQSVYKTQQIFLTKKNKKLNKKQFNIKNKLLAIKKFRRHSRSVDKEKSKEKAQVLSSSNLKKEIVNIDAQIKNPGQKK